VHAPPPSSERLNGLALMTIHKDIHFKYDGVIDQYVMQQNRRLQFEKRRTMHYSVLCCCWTNYDFWYIFSKQQLFCYSKVIFVGLQKFSYSILLVCMVYCMSMNCMRWYESTIKSAAKPVPSHFSSFTLFCCNLFDFFLCFQHGSVFSSLYVWVYVCLQKNRH